MGLKAEKLYFIFNKRMDYERGRKENLSYESGGLMLQSGQTYGWFLSRCLDCREKGNEWHRLRMEGKDVGSGSIAVSLYCTDTPYFMKEGKEITFDSLLTNSDISLGESQKIMASAYVKTVREERDILLHDMRGQYFWFLVEMYSRGSEVPYLKTLRIDFPKRSWLSFMPEIYQRDTKSREFLERFLGIFQSLYEDMTWSIEHIMNQFWPDEANQEFLSFLASWLAIEDRSIWNEEQLRYLVKNAMRLYKMRGTSQYLQEMIQLYTGRPSYVVEFHHLKCMKESQKGWERVKRLYGGNSYLFTILVDTGSYNSTKDFKTLIKIVEHAKPAYMEARIIQLNSYIFLDQYTYIGINSKLSKYRPLKLDGLSALHFTTLMDNRGNEVDQHEER